MADPREIVTRAGESFQYLKSGYNFRIILTRFGS